MLAVFFRYIHFNSLPLLLIFVLLSCATTNNKYQKPPEWIFGNINSNKICYVGSSRPHIRGISYQRALAVSRAIEGIARQKNASVNTWVEHYMSGTSESGSSFLKTYSIQTATNGKISAQIKETWLNRKTNELFILMCEE